MDEFEGQTIEGIVTATKMSDGYLWVLPIDARVQGFIAQERNGRREVLVAINQILNGELFPENEDGRIVFIPLGCKVRFNLERIKEGHYKGKIHGVSAYLIPP